ncbi:hypothetical protein GA0115240_15425 [Streptomyces sp. DvalAA-14]|uniref:hypothetical protein n=1 Tax=unclassified Streptomyces TaxID=2593676 RepID=UPI00081BA539|nr:MULTISPECIES: hypothetical protein [unclassified Streptomyces]MYS23601.1 hypothetical protein [Streptomyces sp. SID4948]SCE36024.1 hypothetical protein GA0115240_15425 [Streptomyces sp. DvalAA-14]
MTIVAVADTEPEEAPMTTCFVIAPIGNEHAPDRSAELLAFEENLEIYEKVILPACAKHGIVPVRADGIADSGEITEQICRHLLQDDIVIADLTGGNANVTYELGIRHLTGKPIIHIGEHGQLPFDLSQIRTIMFKRSRSGLVRARRDLETALEGALHNGFEPLTPARILFGLPAAPPPAAVEAEPDDPEAPGLFDRFARVEEQMEAMSETTEAIAGYMTVIGEVAVQIAPVMERASQPGTPMSAWLPAMSELGKTMAEPASGLREACTRFAGQMVEMDAAVQTAFDVIAVMPPEQRAGSPAGFLEQMVSTAESTQEMVGVLGEVEVGMRWLVKMSRELRAPGRDISAAVKQVTGVVTRIADWERRARELI